MILEITAAADDTPVSLAEVNKHLRTDDGTEDALVGVYIKAAVGHVEAVLGRALITRSYRLTLDQWAGCIRLPMPPLGSVSVVKYDDAEGVERTLNAGIYEIGERYKQSFIRPAPNKAWPALDAGKNGNRVRIDYTAGYGAAADVPEDIRQAILLLVCHFFINRSAVRAGPMAHSIPMGADALLADYKVWEF